MILEHPANKRRIMITQIQERRGAPRAPHGEPIMIRTSDGDLYRGVGSNVSETGMLFETNAVPKDPFWITFTLPTIPHLLQVEAQVVRLQQPASGQTTLGVKFTHVPDDLRRMIRTYVGRGRAQA